MESTGSRGGPLHVFVPGTSGSAAGTCGGSGGSAGRRRRVRDCRPAELRRRRRGRTEASSRPGTATAGPRLSSRRHNRAGGATGASGGDDTVVT